MSNDLRSPIASEHDDVAAVHRRDRLAYERMSTGELVDRARAGDEFADTVLSERMHDEMKRPTRERYGDRIDPRRKRGL